MPSRCRYCQKEASITRPLFRCISCGRNYHSACHIPHPTRSTDWTCHRCIVDSQEAARRHHYHARSSFSLRSASSTTSFRLSTSSTVGFPRRPSSAMGYSVSSSSTDKTQATHLIPCSFPQCEAPSVNIFCAQHLKSFPIPVPLDLAASTSQKPGTAATSEKPSVQPSSSSRSPTTSHSAVRQVSAGKPNQVQSEAEIADATRESPQKCTPSTPVAGPVKNRSSPFPITRSKLLPGNFVRRKTAGKDPYLNRRTPKPGASTHKDSTSSTQHLNPNSAGSASLRPTALSSTTDTSSLSASNDGPLNKSSSLSPSKKIDDIRINSFETRDKPRSEANPQESTPRANMAIDASFLSTEKQRPGELQDGATQPSNQGLPPKKIAELARHVRFSGEMQDAACNGSAVHAYRQLVQGLTPAQNQTPQNSLPSVNHQQSPSGSITNLQVIMPTGQSSNYMSMADRLAVHYARSAFDLAGSFKPPAGLIRGPIPAQFTANSAESNPTEHPSNLHAQDLLHQSRFPSHPVQTVGQPRPLPIQKPQQPPPRPRPIVTNVHKPIVISDSESDSGEHSVPDLRAGSTPPPEPAPQQQSQARRTESQQKQTSQQEQPNREPVPPDPMPESVPELVSRAHPRPQSISQPIAQPTPQLSPCEQANPLPTKIPTPVEQPKSTEPLLPHTTPAVSTYEQNLSSASAAAAAAAALPTSLTKPAQPPIPDEPLFLHIDPRVHWPQRHSQEWFEAKQKEIRARGNRKANFGKAARSMRRRLVAEGPPETLEETLPDKILDNPAWVSMLKKLWDTKPAVGSGKGSGKEKGKETAGASTVATANKTTASAMTTKERRTGGGLKRTLSNVSTGATANGGESEQAGPHKAITTPNPKRRAAGAGLRRVLSNVSAKSPS